MKRCLLIALAMPACLIANRDNVCDPVSKDYNADACRSACNQVTCGTGEGPIVRDGCQCVPCAEIECGAKEYRLACGCMPLHGTVDCTGGNCTATCDSGFDSCDSDAMNGCEAELAVDSAHCGSCTTSCDGAACTNGHCAPSEFRTGLNLNSILATEDYVYYSDSGTYDTENDGAIKRTAIDGGGTLAYYENGADETVGLTVDGNQLYWCKMDYPAELRVAQIDRAGTSLVKTIGTEFSRYCAGSPLARGGALYAWVWIPNGPYELHRLQGANDNVIGTTNHARNFAANSQWLFFADEGEHLRKAPLAGGASMPVADGPAPVALAADETEVFWTSASGVFHVSVDGGTAAMLSGPSDDNAPIYLDATHVYWLTDMLLRVPKSGGDAEMLATIQNGESISGNSAAIYVGAWAGGDFSDKIWRVAK